jgi:hypothetical protein
MQLSLKKIHLVVKYRGNNVKLLFDTSIVKFEVDLVQKFRCVSAKFLDIGQSVKQQF